NGPLAGSSAKEVYRRNPDAELLTLDYGPGSKDLDGLDFGSLDAQQRSAAVADLKACQRVFAVTDRTYHTPQLLTAGYRDAVSIATTPYQRFVAESGLAEAFAAEYHANARGTLSNVTNAVAAVIDVLRGGFDKLQVGNLLPSIQDYLKQLDGF